MDYNYSPENLVEIELTFDCLCEVPCKDSDGLFAWKEVAPYGDEFHSIKGVKVPKEATASKEALQKYLYHEMENHISSFLSLSDANIFDEDEGEYGKSRFN